MLYELEREDYDKTRPLFAGLDYQLPIAAVIEGTSPGRIWVDDARQPRTALLAWGDVCFLAGNEGQAAVNRALNELLADIISAGGRDGRDGGSLVVVCDPDTWEGTLDVVLKGRPPIREHRLHYLLDRPQVDWRSGLPPGFSLEPLDEHLLSRPGLQIPGLLTRWMALYWGSVDGFLRRGLGWCTVYRDQIVCGCLAVCASGNACELGVHTIEDHRRRGLATLTTAATADHCLSRGLTTISWHCHEDNAASRSVAERVGFVKERDYVRYLCLLDRAEHLAELGYRSFHDGEHLKALAWFAQAFETGDPPDWAYHTAARAWAILGHREAALRHLHQAADRGWAYGAFTKECPDLAPLHGTQEWNDLLARMGV